MYNENNYNQTQSLFDRLPTSGDSEGYTRTTYAPAPHTESLFKGLPGSEGTPNNNAYYEFDYNDRTRPTSITVVAVLLTLCLGYSFIQLLGILQYASEIPVMLWSVVLVNYALLIGAIVGMWQMKKYSVWLFVVQTAISTVFSLVLGATGTGLLNLVGSVIMLIFVFRKYDEME